MLLLKVPFVAMWAVMAAMLLVQTECTKKEKGLLTCKDERDTEKAPSSG